MKIILLLTLITLIHVSSLKCDHPKVECDASANFNKIDITKDSTGVDLDFHTYKYTIKKGSSLFHGTNILFNKFKEDSQHIWFAQRKEISTSHVLVDWVKRSENKETGISDTLKLWPIVIEYIVEKDIELPLVKPKDNDHCTLFLNAQTKNNIEDKWSCDPAEQEFVLATSSETQMWMEQVKYCDAYHGWRAPWDEDEVMLCNSIANTDLKFKEVHVVAEEHFSKSIPVKDEIVANAYASFVLMKLVATPSLVGKGLDHLWSEYNPSDSLDYIHSKQMTTAQEWIKPYFELYKRCKKVKLIFNKKNSYHKSCATVNAHFTPINYDNFCETQLKMNYEQFKTIITFDYQELNKYSTVLQKYSKLEFCLNKQPGDYCVSGFSQKLT